MMNCSKCSRKLQWEEGPYCNQCMGEAELVIKDPERYQRVKKIPKATPYEELDKILISFYRKYLHGVTSEQLLAAKSEARKAIKEWSCHHRGCEPEKIPLTLDKWGYGSCIHCGRKK